MRIHTSKHNIYEWLIISSNDGHKFIVLGLNNPFKKTAILFNISCSFSKYTEFVDMILIFFHIFFRYNTKVGSEAIDKLVEQAIKEYEEGQYVTYNIEGNDYITFKIGGSD